MHTPLLPQIQNDVPRNGIAGLKYWRHDLVAGFLVSLINVSFSLAIAVASGAPPIAGLISAIIGGLMATVVGGSSLCIIGPAAGLVPALLASVTSLGHGDLHVGYPRLCAVIVLIGIFQIVLSRFNIKRIIDLIPHTVVEGMLAAIGMSIILKQLPHIFGVPFHGHEAWEILAEIPSQMRVMNNQTVALGMGCLIMLITLSKLRWRMFQLLPPAVLVVGIGIHLAVFMKLESQFLVHVPENILKNGISLPDFRGIIGDRSLWSAALVGFLTLTLIDVVETGATVKAIDAKDPYKRNSDINRVLCGIGIGNMLGAICGGITNIPGGMKSGANIYAGAKTGWSNFYNALFLIIFVLFAQRFLNMIAYPVLAAVLIYTGYNLFKPSVWQKVAHHGRDQLALFILTIVLTLATDLLIGIIGGTIMAQLSNRLAYKPKKALAQQDEISWNIINSTGAENNILSPSLHMTSEEQDQKVSASL